MNDTVGGTAKIMPCELVSWEQVYALSRTLAYAIHNSGFRPDIIIAIGRGGYVPGRILADYLDSMALTSIKVEHYQRGADKQALAQVTYPLCHEIAGMRVLLVDDVSDTGDTYAVALEHLSQWQPAQVVTASLHHKVVSSYEPDHHAEVVTHWRWLIYPWAVLEDLSGFIAKMEPAPATLTGIAQRLQEDYGIAPPLERIGDAMEMIFGKKIPS